MRKSIKTRMKLFSIGSVLSPDLHWITHAISPAHVMDRFFRCSGSIRQRQVIKYERVNKAVTIATVESQNSSFLELAPLIIKYEIKEL